jgi:hypothetical protein
MRRLMLLLTAGLAVFTFGCSSSDDTSQDTTTTTSPSSTTTSSVVVSAANKPTCDAIAGYQAAASAPLSVEETGDPTENATKIQAFVTTLIAPLQAVEAVAPPELQASVATLIATGEATVALDPASAADQATISKALIAPEASVESARTELITWSKDNCGIEVK